MAALWLAAFAQAAPGRAEETAPPPPRVAVGDTAAALPGIVRVGVPGPRTSVVSVAATAGYGLTEAQAEQSGANHRAAGALAVALAPVDWLAVGLKLDGRYDLHPPDDTGKDSGGVGEPHLAVRAGERIGAVGLGGELVAWLPGAQAPAVDFAATTLDARGLVSVSPGAGGTTLAGLLGYRLDRSAETEPHPEQLRTGDRVALGLSDFDALLLGVGISQRAGDTELLGEVSVDWLLGSDAPTLGDSPLRVSAGVRHPLSPRLAFEVLGEVVPTGRPSVAPDAPVAPIEPRFSVWVGLRARALPLPVVAPPATAAPPPPPPPVEKPPPPTAVEKPPPPPEPVICALVGSVVDESGAPVVDAEVKVTTSGGDRVVRTDANGHFDLRDEHCGPGSLIVSAVDFDPVTRDVQLVEGEPPPVELLLRPAVPAGELRGLVRALDGTPIAARIRVAGTNQQATTSAEGAFSLQIPPGMYPVEIEADGYAKQRRMVRIENRGVTILNADLRPVP